MCKRRRGTLTNFDYLLINTSITLIILSSPILKVQKYDYEKMECESDDGNRTLGVIRRMLLSRPPFSLPPTCSSPQQQQQ